MLLIHKTSFHSHVPSIEHRKLPTNHRLNCPRYLLKQTQWTFWFLLIQGHSCKFRQAQSQNQLNQTKLALSSKILLQQLKLYPTEKVSRQHLTDRYQHLQNNDHFAKIMSQ